MYIDFKMCIGVNEKKKIERDFDIFYMKFYCSGFYS